jgi:glutathione peroxidase-family protein
MNDVFAIDLHATDIDGKRVSFDRYRDHVVLVINVACLCGQVLTIDHLLLTCNECSNECQLNGWM